MYVLMAMYVHSDAEVMITDTLSREYLYTYLGLGSCILAIVAELWERFVYGE